jgi:hypothetical protein
MNYRKFLIALLALSGCMVAAWAQESSNHSFLYRRRGCGEKEKSSCVIKLKVREGDSSQVRVYRFDGDGKNIYVDSIRSVILEKGVNSPEFDALIQKLGADLGEKLAVYSFNCWPSDFWNSKEYCPGKRNSNCPKDQVCDQERVCCPGKRNLNYPEGRVCDQERKRKNRRKRWARSGACEAEIVIKKLVLDKEADGRLRIEVEKNIDGKVLKFEKKLSAFNPGYLKMTRLTGGLTEAELKNLKALLTTPCVEELAKVNPDYAQLREKLLQGLQSLPATNAPQTGQIMEKSGEVEEKINLAESDFRCYPNPNQGTFTIEFSAPEKGGFTTLRVLDPNGKKIYEELVEAGSGKYSKALSFPQVAKGAYTVTLENESQKRTQKIIIR